MRTKMIDLHKLPCLWLPDVNNFNPPIKAFLIKRHVFPSILLSSMILQYQQIYLFIFKYTISQHLTLNSVFALLISRNVLLSFHFISLICSHNQFLTLNITAGNPLESGLFLPKQIYFHLTKLLPDPQNYILVNMWPVPGQSVCSTIEHSQYINIPLVMQTGEVTMLECCE